MSGKKDELNKCATECAEVVKRVTEDLISKNSKFIAKQSDIAAQHYDEQEKKFDNFLKAEDRRSTLMMYWNIFMWGVMLTIVGFVAVNSINKANEDEVVKLEELKQLINLGDKYRDSRYVIKQGAADSAQYHWYVKTILFRSQHRSAEISKDKQYE